MRIAGWDGVTFCLSQKINLGGIWFRKFHKMFHATGMLGSSNDFISGAPKPTDGLAPDSSRSKVDRRRFLSTLSLGIGGIATYRLSAQNAGRSEAGVRPGIEVFLKEHAATLAGKSVGLITNPTGVDRWLTTTAGLLTASKNLRVIALYGPEHGVRGDAQAGEYVPFFKDKHFNLPVFSLYGQSKKPEPGMLKNIDEYMRNFDTSHEAKVPDSSMLSSLDAMIFDIQDVGTRVYTYVATMAYAMQACAESRIPFWVLDRPNPINGVDIEGPILEHPKLSSFVGLYPIPMRHGMTAGELAVMFNERFLNPRAELKVVSADGWRRRQWFDETRLPWVIPSPNLPTLDTATVYPGQVLLEGTNLSEGRGTTRPFEIFGAPWIDGFLLTKQLNSLKIPGAVFREVWFTPTFSKFDGQRCGGCQIHVTDRAVFRSYATSLLILQTIKRMAPDQFKFHSDYFDKVAGTGRIRESIQSDQPVQKLIQDFDREAKSFDQARKQYLRYKV